MIGYFRSLQQIGKFYANPKGIPCILAIIWFSSTVSTLSHHVATLHTSCFDYMLSMALHSSHIATFHIIQAVYTFFISQIHWFYHFYTTSLHRSQVQTFNITKLEGCIVIWLSSECWVMGRREERHRKTERQTENERVKTELMLTHLIMHQDSSFTQYMNANAHMDKPVPSTCQWMLGIHQRTSLGHWENCDLCTLLQE